MDGDNGSDSEGEAEDIDWSSETERERDREDVKVSLSHDVIRDGMGAVLTSGDPTHASSIATPISAKTQTRIGSTSSAPLVQSTSLGGISHSLTTGSISKKADKERVGGVSVDKNAGVSDQITTLLSGYPSALSGCWLCSYADLPHMSSIPVPTVNCPTANAVKQALGQVVNKILSFCNSNSSNPPITWVGVVGGDKFIGQ
ncbi:hypothetical protein OESDEN_10512, partial [Oesophagostomum dentatum]